MLELMESTVSLEEIRLHVAALLSGDSAVSPDELRETILIRDGLYCGRRFELQDRSAVWFAEEGEIKVYSPDARVQRIELDVAPTRRPLAA
jgi:hypothetical protein